MKVMFAGDIHGNLDHALWLFDHAVENDVDVIISCGDFGYWPHFGWGKHFLNSIERLARENEIKFFWVDGNHENHDLLDMMVAEEGSDAPIPMGSVWLNYIPRGCVFTLGSTTIMGYGGAYSWDWKERELGISWWRQELINDYKVAELPHQKVDILVTHEAPLGKNISYKDDIALSVRQRELVSEIQSKVNPSLHVCGHHHTRETWMNDTTEVHVLGRDEMEDESVLIITID